MGLEGEDGDETMLQMATNPLAQPTAMSLGESHVTDVHTVECGFASKTGDCSLSELLVWDLALFWYLDVQYSVWFGSRLSLTSMTLTRPSPHTPARRPTLFCASLSSSFRGSRGIGHQAIRLRSPQSVHSARRNRGLDVISIVLVSDAASSALSSQSCRADG